MNGRKLITSTLILALAAQACAQGRDTAPIPTANPSLLEQQNYETYEIGQTANINLDDLNVSFYIPSGAQTNGILSIFILKEESLEILDQYSEYDLQNLPTQTTREGSKILVSDVDGNQFLLENEAIIVTMPDGTKIAFVDEGEDPEISNSLSIAGVFNVVNP